VWHEHHIANFVSMAGRLLRHVIAASVGVFLAENALGNGGGDIVFVA
jgi:hypothetical protein